MTLKKKTFIKIEGWGEMELEYLMGMVKNLKDGRIWTFKIWKPIPALIDKNGKTSRPFIGQQFDPNYFDLVPNGWDHDHCEICTQKISDKEAWGDIEGYNSGLDWICKQCYGLFMTASDTEKELSKYQRFDK
jgi:hypothetical protein